MGAGSSSKGGGMPARQRGGGGFSPRMPSRYTGMPMNPIRGISRGLPALGGKGGGYPGRQMPPYIDPMPMPAPLPPRSYREMWESQQPAYQRPMPSIGASSRAMEAALRNQPPVMRPPVMRPMVQPSATGLAGRAAMEEFAAEQARNAGLQVGPTPGQQPDPFSGMSIGQRLAMNEQIQRAQMEADQRARGSMMLNQGPYQAQQQAQAQAQMAAMNRYNQRLMPPRSASGIASLGGGKGATRAAPQLGMRQYGTPTWSPLPAAQMDAIAQRRANSARNDAANQATQVVRQRRGHDPDRN